MGVLKSFREGMRINDIYTHTFNHMDEYICDDLVHLTLSGIDLFALKVNETLQARLEV